MGLQVTRLAICCTMIHFLFASSGSTAQRALPRKLVTERHTEAGGVLVPAPAVLFGDL